MCPGLPRAGSGTKSWELFGACRVTAGPCFTGAWREAPGIRAPLCWWAGDCPSGSNAPGFPLGAICPLALLLCSKAGSGSFAPCAEGKLRHNEGLAPRRPFSQSLLCVPGPPPRSTSWACSGTALGWQNPATSSFHFHFCCSAPRAVVPDAEQPWVVTLTWRVGLGAAAAASCA